MNEKSILNVSLMVIVTGCFSEARFNRKPMTI